MEGGRRKSHDHSIRRAESARLLTNPKVKAEYDALAPEFEISAEFVKTRLRAGLSQAELAARMGASQSAIARLESGQTLPSTRTLLRFTGARQQVSYSPPGSVTRCMKS
jgi:ribosome-binding protein aMBF1 (putative translation factor)